MMRVADKHGATYKAYSAGENAYVEIFELPTGRWAGEAVMVFRPTGPAMFQSGAVAILTRSSSCACTRAI